MIPIVFPLVAGPASFTTLLSLCSMHSTINILIALALNLVWVYIVLSMTSRIERLLGKSGIYIARKFFGVILLAVSVGMCVSNVTKFISVAGEENNCDKPAKAEEVYLISPRSVNDTVTADGDTLIFPDDNGQASNETRPNMYYCLRSEGFKKMRPYNYGPCSYGVVCMPNGTKFYSSWTNACVYRMENPTGEIPNTDDRIYYLTSGSFNYLFSHEDTIYSTTTYNTRYGLHGDIQRSAVTFTEMTELDVRNGHVYALEGGSLASALLPESRTFQSLAVIEAQVPWEFKETAHGTRNFYQSGILSSLSDSTENVEVFIAMEAEGSGDGDLPRYIVLAPNNQAVQSAYDDGFISARGSKNFKGFNH